MEFFKLKTFPFPALALAAAIAMGPARAQVGWVPVTDGKSAAGLYKSGSGEVKYSDAGVITVSGGNGYLATNKEYTHFRTRIEWNNNNGGNSGFLYHIVNNAIWPLGLECQMHSDDVGSLWTTGAKFNSTGVKSGNDMAYSETGTALIQHGTTGTGRNHFIRSQNPGAPVGQWNTWEMYVKGDSLEIKANNKVTMRIWKLTINNGTPLVKGKIGLQIEGATVQWRNWEIQDLSLPSRIAVPEPGLLAKGRNARLRIGSLGEGLPMSASAALPGSGLGRLADLNGRQLRILPQP